jgi:hypothetical protein
MLNRSYQPYLIEPFKVIRKLFYKDVSVDKL